jgi:hypothetical protein
MFIVTWLDAYLQKHTNTFKTKEAAEKFIKKARRLSEGEATDFHIHETKSFGLFGA